MGINLSQACERGLATEVARVSPPGTGDGYVVDVKVELLDPLPASGVGRMAPASRRPRPLQRMVGIDHVIDVVDVAIVAVVGAYTLPLQRRERRRCC